MAREAAVGVVSLAPALLALRGGDLASYHGVEHKAIAAYEQDRDANAVDKEHDRCGSNLVQVWLGRVTHDQDVLFRHAPHDRITVEQLGRLSDRSNPRA